MLTRSTRSRDLDTMSHSHTSSLSHHTALVTGVEPSTVWLVDNPPNLLSHMEISGRRWSGLFSSCVSSSSPVRYLKPDILKTSKHKTAVMKKTLNPEFNEVRTTTPSSSSSSVCSDEQNDLNKLSDDWFMFNRQSLWLIYPKRKKRFLPDVSTMGWWCWWNVMWCNTIQNNVPMVECVFLRSCRFHLVSVVIL